MRRVNRDGMTQARDWTQPSEKTLVSYEVRDGVAYLTLSDPPANTYSYAMMRQLDDAILRARFDDSVHVLVLTGAGEKFFCAGANIQMLQEVTPGFKYFFCLHANETLSRLEQTPKLVIAAINGHCVGGGLEVALACDLRVAAAGEFKLGLPEVNLGVLPGTGGTQRLTRLLGRAKALELMVEGKNFSVSEGERLGVVTKTFAPATFRAAVHEYARGFVPPGRASMSVGHIKRAVVSGSEMSFTDALAFERELQQRLFTSADAAEGIRAYNEKRSPKFSGR
jgi:enoyl-CoA hydratase